MEDPRREIRDAYDAIAAEYTADRAESPPELEAVADVLEGLPAGGRVLDAGCGAGDPVTAALADRVETVGLDFSGGQLALAAERAPAAALVCGEMTRLPFADDSFDAVFSVYAVVHVPWEHHRRCFAAFHRVLRPGGEALLTVGTTDWSGTNDDWMGYGEPMHWEIPGEERTTDLLAAVGFDVEESFVVEDDVGEESGVKLFVRARATAAGE